MAMWRSRSQMGANAATAAWYISGDAKKVPKGYVPMVLVDNREKDGDDQGQRILVHVQMLREPCMAALLEMAAQQFGLDQRGVLRIPCSVIRFEQVMIKGTEMLEEAAR